MDADTIPFCHDYYALREGLLLRPISEQEADHAGKALAFMDPWSTLGYSPNALSRYLLRHDPALNRYVVEVSERAAGILCVRHPWLLGPYIELLALYIPFQGTGIGKAIIEWIESQAHSASRNIWTLVSSFNAPGRKFYEKAGFMPVAPLDDLVASGFSEILLRKRM